MGIVYHEQPFDDTFSQDIIRRIRENSTDLDDYVITQKYLIETQEENLTPAWLRNRLVCKVIEYLSDLGILINFDTDQLADQPLLVDAVVTLLAKFGEDRFNLFLNEHKDLANDISQLLDDDCIDDIIGCCNRAVPLDEGWESLQTLLTDRPGFFGSDDTFNELVTAAVAYSDRLGDEEMFTGDDDMSKLLQYNEYLMKRKEKIKSIVNLIWCLDNGFNPNAPEYIARQSAVSLQMKEFEKELSRPSIIRQFIDGEVPPKQFVEQRRSFFLSKWKHCLEYWVSTADKAAIPSTLEAAILVATLYVDAPDPEHARVYVVQTFENLIDVLGDRYETFRSIIDNALGNLAVESEVSKL